MTYKKYHNSNIQKFNYLNSILVYVRDGVNPSFREYYYDPWNKTILTYKQYYLPLDKLLPDEEEEFYDQDEKLIGTNMGPPKYLSIQGM